MGKKTKASGAALKDSAEEVGGLFRSSTKVDPALASLFAPQPTPQPVFKARTEDKSKSVVSKKPQHTEESSSESEDGDDADGDNESEASSSGDDEELSSSDVEEADENSKSDSEIRQDESEPVKAPALADLLGEGATKSRRKRKRDDEDLEEKYMERLAKEEEREEAKRKKERGSKRQKSTEAPAQANGAKPATNDDEDNDDEGDNVQMKDAKSSDDEENDESDFEIPQHESLSNNPATEIEKANRTVFLGNVASSAVTDKSAKKALVQHMSSILAGLSKPADGEMQHKVESVRFRSTAYTNMLPKKASFVTQDLMESTTHATNAYVVFSTKVAAREALKLNGTVVLGRHLRVDSVAHPAKTEHRRCVFVGNLGFVDDESAVLAAEAKEGKDGKKKKPRKKVPSDIEEGLWREFGKCGTVENVRVVRDSKTRVGKGIAYVQFTDENAVEAALLYDGKKFPPMLPRNLRVSRAKGMKRNAKKDHSGRPSSNGVYNPKVSEEQKSALGRASKLLGRAGAALQSRTNPVNANATPLSKTRLPSGAKMGEVKAPESFVFEGHRATQGSFTAGRGKKKDGKVSGSKKKVGRPSNHATRRTKAWKLGGEK